MQERQPVAEPRQDAPRDPGGAVVELRIGQAPVGCVHRDALGSEARLLLEARGDRRLDRLGREGVKRDVVAHRSVDNIESGLSHGARDPEEKA